MATDEEVTAKQEEVAKLRADLESLHLGEGAQVLNEASNEITLTQLKTEEANLRAAIAERKGAGTEKAVAAGAAAPLAVATEQMKAAVARQKAAEKASSRSSGSTSTTKAGE